MVTTRKIDQHDIDSITEIHCEAFPGFFLTSLGKSFLRLYYRSFIKSKDGICFCAVDDKYDILGFCFGTLNSSGFHKRLIFNNILSFSIEFFLLLLSKPGSLLRLFLNFEKEPVDIPEETVSELLSIGVKKTAEGKGIGRTLLKIFEEDILLRNGKIITLTTDFYNNEKVIEFYLRSGYHIYCDFTAFPNRRMYKMLKKLNL